VGINEEARINGVKARLQQPISTFLPENSPIWSGQIPSWAYHVTLHQLLTHTSGIPNFTDINECDKENGSGKIWWELPHTSADMIALIGGKELLFLPGTKSSYSNTGYTILADIIEAITKKSFSEYLQEALFDPLDLKSTSSADKGRWEELSKLDRYSRLVSQWNYDPRGNQNEIYSPVRSADISYGKGAGSIISTAEDLLKWNRALHKECSVLPKALYESLISPYAWEGRFGIGYGIGIGIGIGESSLGKVYQHSGSMGTYRTYLAYFPEQDLSIIVLTHIAYDSSKILNEYNELLETLKVTYPDEAERRSEAHQCMQKKYPGTRGFEKIGESYNQL
jgi:CubicO group peptidase (beta-lactamase class C family)